MDDVTLRPIQESDLDELSRFATDPEARGEFLWTGFTDSRAARRRWEEDGWLGGGPSSWLAVARGEDGTLAGIVSWTDCSLGITRGTVYEIGISLFPPHRGQGVGTEAQRQLVRYLFDHTPVHRIWASTEVDNLAEQRALVKAGFQREGVLRGCYFRAGRWRDVVVYAQVREHL